MKPRASRRGRLSRSAEFERVYRHGRSSANRHLVLYAFPNPAVERPRLGLSVSRKVGGAVERNRVKRLLREAFDEVELQLHGGQDFVVVARPEVRELAERDGLKGVGASLLELLDRTGTRVAEGGSSAAAAVPIRGEGSSSAAAALPTLDESHAEDAPGSAEKGRETD